MDTRYRIGGQEEYVFKKIAIYEPYCTCGNQIGRYQKEHMDLIMKILEEDSEIPLNKAQLKASRSMGFVRDCCQNKIQNYPAPHITNENGYAYQTIYSETGFGASMSEPIRRDGPSVKLQKSAPQYPSLNGAKITSPKIKQTGVKKTGVKIRKDL